MNLQKRSPIWNFFTAIDKDYAKCDICNQKMSYKSSTSNMKRHINRKHPTVQLNVESNERDREKLNDSNDSIKETRNEIPSASNQANDTTASLNTPGTSTSSSEPAHQRKQHPGAKQTYVTSFFSQKQVSLQSKKKIDEELLLLFTLDYQPFRVVEDKGFRRFVRTRNPGYVLPDRKTISKSMIPALYEKYVMKCKEEIKTVENVCLTTDCWKSINNESYMTVTAHYIDNIFQLRSMLLKCSSFGQSHTSANLSKELISIVQEWGLREKINVAISDNASNIKNAISEILGWKHFGCFAHSINLVVQSGLHNLGIEGTLNKVKDVVSYFRRSGAANTKLMNYEKNCGIQQPKQLKQECATRWNSTLYMLVRFVEMEDALRATIAILDSDLPVLTLEEWSLMRDLITILTPFKNVTTAISGENYMTASLVIVFVAGLFNVLNELLKFNGFECEISVTMVTHLISEMTSRFDNVEYNTILACCTFLDPRFKMHVFRSKVAADLIKKKIINLVTEIISKNSLENQSVLSEQETPSTSAGTGGALSIWSSIDKTLAKYQPLGTSSSRAIAEVQRYVEDNIIDRKLDPLRWWKDHEYAYPNLSAIAKEKLCALVTSVPCERLFSAAGQVLNERRTRLKSTQVEKLLFLNMNQSFV